jgi:hypothetical protein
MHIKKHLSFAGLRKALSKRFEEVADPRAGNVIYSMHDCLMSAFAMMCFQDPSLLVFQRRLQESSNLNNLKSIFHIDNIPGDTQLRETIDAADSEPIEAAFTDFFRGLQRGKHLENYQVLDGRYLIVVDGGEYFSSEKIHCPGCLFKTAANGNVRYHHQILQVAMVHPDKRQVLPLAPEPIRNGDGAVKQDCEINAGKRVLAKIRADHPKMKFIVGGDGLYAKQPYIDELKAARMSFVLVAKPTDHKVLFEWVDELRRMKETGILERRDSKGNTHIYQWANQVPLNGQPKSDQVHFFEYTLIGKDGKNNYHNSWVTDVAVDENNVVELVKCGRARWKIENECFNTLKNQGYHIEHNFGHGEKNLSYHFFLLNLLAFFMHQIFELTDTLYQKCRAKFTSRVEYWNVLKYTIRIILFKSWEHLLTFILKPPEISAP